MKIVLVILLLGFIGYFVYPFIVGDGQIYIEVPGNSRFATVRLTYKDGTRSETVRIDR